MAGDDDPFKPGVWRCRTIFNCTEAWPGGIRITRAIGEVKKAILKGSRDIPLTPRRPRVIRRGRMKRNRPRGDDAAGRFSY
jgi:heterodisulfide reductase subunit C